MTSCPVPILDRSFEDALKFHPCRHSLLQLADFAEQVLAPALTPAGVALVGELGSLAGLELMVVLADEAPDGPSAILWDMGEGGDSRPTEIGLRWCSLSRMARQTWPEGTKHALSQGILLWDGHDDLRSFLETRLWYPDALRCHRLLDNSVRIYEILHDGAVFSQSNRVGWLQAHYLLTTALDRVIDQLFDFHQVWRPSPIGRLPAFQRLSWLPPHFETRLEAAMRIDGLSQEALMGRKAAVESLFEPLQSRVEAESWWPKEPRERWRVTVGGL